MMDNEQKRELLSTVIRHCRDNGVCIDCQNRSECSSDSPCLKCRDWSEFKASDKCLDKHGQLLADIERIVTAGKILDAHPWTDRKGEIQMRSYDVKEQLDELYTQIDTIERVIGDLEKFSKMDYRNWVKKYYNCIQLHVPFFDGSDGLGRMSVHIISAEASLLILKSHIWYLRERVYQIREKYPSIQYVRPPILNP